MENNKKLILIVIAAVIVVTIVAIFLVRMLSDSDNSSGGQNTNNTTNPNGIEQPGSDSGGGVNMVNNGGYRNSEFIYLLEGVNEEGVMSLRETESYLMSNKLYKICMQVAEPTEQKECLNKLKSYQVAQIGDPKLCEQIDGNRNSCIMNIAAADNDVELCKEIDDKVMQDECINIIIHAFAWQEDNVTLCYQAPDEQNKLSCIKRVIQEHQDLAYCDESIISTNGLFDDCRSIIMINQVIANNDTSICEQIPVQDYKDMCFTEFAL